MTKRISVNLIIDFILLIVLIVGDQFTKYLAVINLKEKSAIPLISGVLELNYLENKGAAFGMLKNQKWFFIFVAIIILACIIYVLAKAPTEKKYIVLHILLTLIAAGAIGNMIDRMMLGFVVDFIYFKLINFPIFNVADMYVTCATFILIFIILFGYNENDFKFLSFHTDKYRILDESSQGDKNDR